MQPHHGTRRRLCLALAFGLAPVAFADSDSGHDWSRLATTHFVVDYDQSTAHLAPQALDIAERTEATLAGYFGWDPGYTRVSIVLTDDNDEANGDSYGIVPLVHIECRKVPIAWRGETDWLRTVISHELTHIYTLQQMQRPFDLALSWSYHSDPGRDDFMASSAIGAADLPEWFVEGIAQMGSMEFHADFRDPWRETLLRDAYLHGHLLTLSEMGRFEGTSREAELAYNQGFDFLDFLVRTHPELPLKPLCGSIWNLGFESAFRKRYGRSTEDLYGDWVRSLAARFPPAPADSLGTPVLPRRAGPLLWESSVAGPFAITNWNNDDLRLDLFERTGGVWKEDESDVGAQAVFVPATRELWYGRWVRNSAKDVLQMELFRRDSAGRETRETRHARCLAFDADATSLTYASYDAGTTRIVRRSLPSRTETVLHSFPMDTAVYGLFRGGGDTVFLSLGTGKARRSAVLVDGVASVLWARSPSTWDAQRWRGDTLVFASDASGLPRLYWATESGPWHPIHEGSDGVFGLKVDRSGDSPSLLARVYEDGEQRIRRVDGPWGTDSLAVAVPASDSGSWTDPAPMVASTSAVADIVRLQPVFSLQYQGVHLLDSNQDVHASSTYFSISQDFTDAAGQWGFGGRGGIAYSPVAHSLSLWPEFSGGAWRKFGDAVLDASASWTYSGSRDVPEDAYGVYHFDFAETDLDLLLTKPVGLYGLLDLAGGYLWVNEQLDFTSYTSGIPDQTLNYGSIDSRIWYRAGGSYQDLASRFDPAALGQPGPYLWAWGQGNRTAVPYRYQGRLSWWAGSAGAQECSWIGDRASLTGSLDAYGISGGIFDTTVVPSAYVSMGGTGPFSGYSDEYLDLRDWVRFQATFRTDPFLHRTLPLKALDRFHLAAHLEVGEIEYLVAGTGEPSMRNALAANWDLSALQSFYVWNTTPSYVEVGIGQPLIRVVGARRNDPYRLFLSVVL
jgi:hypothetical protein